MFDFLSKYYPLFFCGTAQTVIISLIGVAIGILLGLIVVSMRMSDFKVLSWLARCYVSIVRGTPAMIPLLYFLPIFFSRTLTLCDKRNVKMK